MTSPADFLAQQVQAAQATQAFLGQVSMGMREAGLDSRLVAFVLGRLSQVVECNPVVPPGLTPAQQKAMEAGVSAFTCALCTALVELWDCKRRLGEL